MAGEFGDAVVVDWARAGVVVDVAPVGARGVLVL